MFEQEVMECAECKRPFVDTRRYREHSRTCKEEKQDRIDEVNRQKNRKEQLENIQ